MNRWKLTRDGRRAFLRVLGTGGAAYVLSAPTGLAAEDGESRLVQGELKTWRSHAALSRLEVAFRFLERTDLKSLPVGRHELGGQVYAVIDKSSSLPPEKVVFEVHRKYIDVHYMISGQVTTGFAPVEKLKLYTPYDEKAEAAMYYVPASYTKVKLYPGNFAVFFPGGGHMPNCHLDGVHDLHKVVVKVPHDYGTR
jgi:YhcH/YjgK/YiaL family protein